MKRILLIAYNFPPLMNAQSLRWVQFIKYLVRDGYGIDVLTIAPEKRYVGYSESSMDTVPKEVRVFRSSPGPLHILINRYLPLPKSIKETHYKYSLKSALRQQVKFLYKKIIEPSLIPDDKVVWLPWGLKLLRELKGNAYDLIISSAMPFTCHILGYYFKKWTKTPWIMDYGDPWVFSPLFHSWRYLLDSRIEKKFLRKADHILVTTDSAIDGFIQHYPFLEHTNKFSVIYQGYDKELLENVRAKKGRIFRILYTGIFYDTIRPPYIFFEAIRQLNDIKMEVIVVGEVQQQYLKMVQEKNLERKIFFLGRKSHEETVALQKGADVLLFWSYNTPSRLAGKIFEYIGASRPILGIQFIENDPAISLIKKYNRGFVVSNDANEIASAIKKIYKLWQDGELENQFSFEHVKEYTWEYQAMKLKNIIDALIQ